HYQRKENAFFPKLELHGITGPSKVMWAKDDEVRALLKSAGAASAAPWNDAFKRLAEKAVLAVEEMMYKEDNILLRMCMDTFTEEDWAEIWLSSPRYGWCLVEPRDGYRPPESVVKEGLTLPSMESIQLPTGNLSLKQLVGIFSTLPVDITFVDAEDRVAFFSEGPDRVFARSRAIIGRKVQHCHPPRSVDVVERILTDFREGRQSVAEFWINFQGRFVHIRYFALRDEANQYLGTLEVTQDAARLRALEGERRLLEYN
ncbi:MAG TPA: PAS domain-containing protein, partial [Bryobacteraceae bacterium]|nr:PAS domain-containing protein [Bryobacteraceae bacterium]